MTSPESIQEDQINLKPPTPKNPAIHSLFIKILVGSITFIITLTILIWISFPVPDLVSSWAISRYTPTPIPSTATLVPSTIPTMTQTPTPIPTPTATHLPPSNHEVADLTQLTPAVPPLITSAVVLNEDTSVTAVPGFDDIQWTSSSQITDQIGVEFSEPYFATFGPGSATWVVDTPLDPGLYEIFVLDTLYSSGGVLNFNVKLGDEGLSPLIGSTSLEYKSSRGNPPQRSDEWRSIGIFNINRADIISVSTSWELRDELTIVAIDRLMIAKLPDSLYPLLDGLPKDQLIYIVDDSEAEFEALQYWEPVEKGPAWGDQYHLLQNPPIAVKATWKLPDRVPTGKYEVFAWIPKINGTANINYKLTVEDTEIEPTGEIPPVTSQGDDVDPHWQAIGSWVIPEIFGDEVQLALEVDVDAETIGEVAVDAVAFVRIP